MRVFAVSGYSGTGKTSIVESIVKSLHSQGHSIITVKSSKHDLKEEEGTDSWRHRQAGSKSTIVLGPSSSFVYHGERHSLQQLLQGSEAEYLIVEGMKESNIPKFWCIGDSEIEEDTIPKSVKAIVAWKASRAPKDLEIPIIQADDVERLVTIIEREAIDLSELDV